MRFFTILIFLTFITTSITASLLTNASNCPKKCSCKGNKITCKGRPDIPTDVPDTVESLEMSGCQLVDITDMSFPKVFSNLRSLSLINSEISDISDNAFQHQKRLKVLNLSGNKLKFVKKSVFDPLENLSELNLASNFLTAIPDINLPYLTKLTLSNNKISKLQFHKSYDEITTINTIKLSNNPLGVIPKNAFKHLGKSKLQSLQLKSCQIKSIDKDAFSPIALSLSSLDLSKNGRITTENLIQALGPFRYVPALKTLSVTLMESPSVALFNGLHVSRLSLSGSALGTLNGGIFKDLSELKFLSVKNCKITKISQEDLSPLNGLIELNLDKNGITKFDDNIFYEFNNLRTLSLRSNRGLILNQNSFVGLKKLENLQLPKCGIVKLEDSIKDLSSLRTLNLADNQLHGEFQIANFNPGLKRSLRELDLSSNPSLTFDSALFNSFAHLLLVSLKGTLMAKDMCTCGSFQPVERVILPIICRDSAGVTSTGRGKKTKWILECKSSKSSKTQASTGGQEEGSGIVSKIGIGFASVGTVLAIASAGYVKRKPIKNAFSKLGQKLRPNTDSYTASYGGGRYRNSPHCDTALEDEMEEGGRLRYHQLGSFHDDRHQPATPASSQAGSLGSADQLLQVGRGGGGGGGLLEHAAQQGLPQRSYLAAEELANGGGALEGENEEDRDDETVIDGAASHFGSFVGDGAVVQWFEESDLSNGDSWSVEPNVAVVNSTILRNPSGSNDPLVDIPL